MSDKHPEIECYECGRLKTRLIWNSRCVTCTVQRLEANQEENNNLRDQLAALKEKNERLKARVVELESLVRDIRQHDINETTKRLLEGGRKFNYSLPLNIRERIAAALKEPANEDQK